MPHQREVPRTKIHSASHSKKEKHTCFEGLLQDHYRVLQLCSGIINEIVNSISVQVWVRQRGLLCANLPGLISMTTSHWISTLLRHSVVQPWFSRVLLLAPDCASPSGSTTISEHPQWAPVPSIFTCVQTCVQTIVLTELFMHFFVSFPRTLWTGLEFKLFPHSWKYQTLQIFNNTSIVISKGPLKKHLWQQNPPMTELVLFLNTESNQSTCNNGLSWPSLHKTEIVFIIHVICKSSLYYYIYDLSCICSHFTICFMELNLLGANSNQ